MHILAIEDRSGAGAGDARRLRALGHDVSRCYGVADRPFPCRSLAGTCPLDGADGIDLVVDSRAGASLDATASEAGGVCALRRGIPVLVRGATDPFPGWSVVQEEGEPLEAACERAVEVQARAQAALVVDEAVRVLAGHGVEVPRPTARVTRTGRRTSIAVDVAVPLDAALRGTLATRVHAVHRASASPESVLDVAVTCPDATATA